MAEFRRFQLQRASAEPAADSALPTGMRRQISCVAHPCVGASPALARASANSMLTRHRIAHESCGSLLEALIHRRAGE